MCSVTAALIGAQVIGGISEANSINRQYNAQRQAYEAQAQAAQQNAKIKQAQNERVAEQYATEQRKLNDRLRLVRGQQAAAAGASGISGGMGSVLDAASAADDAWRSDSASLLNRQREDTWANYVQQVNFENQANAYNSAAEQIKKARKRAMLGSIVGSALSIYGTAKTGNWFDANKNPATNTLLGAFSDDGNIYNAQSAITLANTSGYETSIGGNSIFGNNWLGNTKKKTGVITLGN